MIHRIVLRPLLSNSGMRSRNSSLSYLSSVNAVGGRERSLERVRNLVRQYFAFLEWLILLRGS